MPSCCFILSCLSSWSLLLFAPLFVPCPVTCAMQRNSARDRRSRITFRAVLHVLPRPLSKVLFVVRDSWPCEMSWFESVSTSRFSYGSGRMKCFGSCEMRIFLINLISCINNCVDFLYLFYAKDRYSQKCQRTSAVDLLSSLWLQSLFFQGRKSMTWSSTMERKKKQVQTRTLLVMNAWPVEKVSFDRYQRPASRCIIALIDGHGDLCTSLTFRLVGCRQCVKIKEKKEDTSRLEDDYCWPTCTSPVDFQPWPISSI